jgi:thiol-disulfide isomerase/thioredoxin
MTAPAAAPLVPETRDPGVLTRLGLAIVHPRWALTLAGDRRTAGRSGSDMIAAFLLLLVGTQLRGLASAAWFATSVDAGLGLHTAIRVLTGALTVDLGLLVIGAFALFVLAGRHRNLGRAFDLACVAALPLVFVDLTATVIVRATGEDGVPVIASWLLSGLAYGWMGALIALAIRPARIAPARVPAPPREAQVPARRAGIAVIALVVVGIVVQAVWLAGHLDLVRPMSDGEPAPAFALPQVGPAGQLGDRLSLDSTRGKVTVLDFWATWCGPCLASMPKLEQLARSHADVRVLAINTDDPVAARSLFNQKGYTLKLLSDDSNVADRYGAATIPYTVIIDRSGVIRHVVRGTGRDPEHDLTALVDRVSAAK